MTHLFEAILIDPGTCTVRRVLLRTGAPMLRQLHRYVREIPIEAVALLDGDTLWHASRLSGQCHFLLPRLAPGRVFGGPAVITGVGYRAVTLGLDDIDGALAWTGFDESLGSTKK